MTSLSSDRPSGQTPPDIPSLALTLTQPWATLVAFGEKCIETRSWSTQYTGPLAIHAAKGFPRAAMELCLTEPFRTALRRCGVATIGALPVGQMVATCRLAGCMQTTQITRIGFEALDDQGLPGWKARPGEFEYDFGDYGVRRFGFLLDGIARLAQPIPARGMLSLWTIPPDVRALMQEPAHV